MDGFAQMRARETLFGKCVSNTDSVEKNILSMEIESINSVCYDWTSPPNRGEYDLDWKMEVCTGIYACANAVAGIPLNNNKRFDTQSIFCDNNPCHTSSDHIVEEAVYAAVFGCSVLFPDVRGSTNVEYEAGRWTKLYGSSLASPKLPNLCYLSVFCSSTLP